LDYNVFSSNKSKLKDLIAQQNPQVQASSIDISGLNISIFGITLNGIGKLPTGSAFTPYGILGFGIHILGISDGTASANGQSTPISTGVANQTKFGLNFGAGSEFALGITKLFFEVKYVLIFTEGNSTGHVPILVGVSFGG
jgi:opacity protein-like surface antigen